MTSFGGGFFQKRLVNERAKGGNSFAAEERILSNDIKSSPFFLYSASLSSSVRPAFGTDRESEIEKKLLKENEMRWRLKKANQRGCVGYCYGVYRSETLFMMKLFRTTFWLPRLA